MKQLVYRKIYHNLQKIANILFVTIVLACMLLLFLQPAHYSKVIFSALMVWATAVLPSILPFFVLTKILSLIDFGQKNKIKCNIFGKLFGCGRASGYVFLMSFVCGFPVGAKVAQDFFKKGLLSEHDMRRIVRFCALTSPLFILGVCGQITKNATMCVAVLLVCTLSGVLNGIKIGKADLKDLPQKNQAQLSLSQIVYQGVYDSVLSVLCVGGFICMFYLFTHMLMDTKVVYPIIYALDLVHKGLGNAVVLGFFEITQGVLACARGIKNDYVCFVFLCGLMSFGGLCVFLQSMAYLGSCKVLAIKFFLSKLRQTAISVVIALLLGLVLY